MINTDKVVIYINAIEEDKNDCEIFSVAIYGKVYYYLILVEGIKKTSDYAMLNIYVKGANIISYGGTVFGWENETTNVTLTDYESTYYKLEKVYLK